MDDAEARRILTEHGEQVTRRGKLSDEARLRAQHLADQDAGGDEYADGTSPGDFGDDPAPLTSPELKPEPEPERPANLEERRPQPVKRTRRQRKPLRERLAGDGKRPKRKHPRMPVDQLISSAWAALGGLAGQVDPPVGRCLVLQAPVAGLILEDVVRGTAADRILQPIARAEERAEKVLALVGPPAIVAALEASQALPERQRAAREAVLLPLLHRSLVLWVRIAGDQADKMVERQQEEGPAAEAAAKLMAAILGTPAAQPEPEPETVRV